MIRRMWFTSLVFCVMAATICSAGVDITKGHFRVVLDDQGRGNVFQDGQPIFDQIQPIPYLRNTDYSICKIPGEFQNINIEKKETSDEATITIRGGNSAYVSSEVQITLIRSGIIIEATFTTGESLEAAGVGCRYYLNKNLFCGRDVEYATTDGKKGVMRLDDKQSERKLLYKVQRLQAWPSPNCELTYCLDDSNTWCFQNLQETYLTKDKHYLLFYELPDWKPGQKRTWKQRFSLYERRLRKYFPYEFQPPCGPAYDPRPFPSYVGQWDDKKTDLFYGKRDAIYLNGWWKLIQLKDTEKNSNDDYGTKNGFYREGFDDRGWQRFFVPWCDFENREDNRFRGVSWYRRTFDVPAAYRDKRLILEFSQVLSEATVWINGRLVGKHKMTFYNKARRSCFGAFSFDITDFVRFGQTNTIAVRTYHDWNGGICQPVQISVYPRLFIQKALVNSDVDKGRITVRCFFNNGEKKERTVHLSAMLSGWKSYRYHLADKIRPYSHDLGEVKVPPGMSEKTFVIPVKAPVFWTYEKPMLYHLTFDADGEQIGQTRFGFRQVTIRGVHFYLNGKKMWIPADEPPILSYLNFLPFNQEIDRTEGGYDDKLRPANPYAMNLDEWFQRHKNMNLTMLRAHTDCWPEPMFDRADEIGMMVYPELDHLVKSKQPFDVAGEQTLYEGYLQNGSLPKGYKEQNRDRIHAHWNHPSIWAYSLGNEMYNIAFTPFLIDMYHYFKDDVKIPFPLSQSGRYYSLRSDDAFTPLPDFYDDHYYSTRYEQWIDNERRSSELNTYIHGKLDRPWINGECFGLYRHFNWYNLDVFFESLRKYLPNIPRKEYVALCSRTDEDFSSDLLYTWGLARDNLQLYGIRDYLLETERGNPRRGEYYKRLMETHRRWNQYISGVITHIVMPDRQEKKITVFGEMMKRVNSPLYVCTDLYFRHHFLAGDDFTTNIYTFNDTFGDVADITVAVDIVDENGKPVFHRTLHYDVLTQGEKKIHPFVWKIPEDQKTGHYICRLTLLRGGKKIVDNEYGTYILGPDRRRKEIQGGDGVALYLPPSKDEDQDNTPRRYVEKLDATVTEGILKRLKVAYHPIRDFESLDKYRILILGVNSFDSGLKSAGPRIRKWVEQGGKLLCFEQCNYLGAIPFAREYEIDETKVPFVDLIVPQHPLFDGLNGYDWDMWDGGDWAGDKGIITTKHIQPLSESVLATSAFHRQFGMTASEVRIGKGIVLFSQPFASCRYGEDSVATRYVENLLHYTLETPWDGKGIANYEIPVISGEEIGIYDVRPVDPARAFYVNLRKAANRGFRDEKGMDGKGGWFDEGEAQDLRLFPVGRQTFEGVPFQIIDPKENDGRSCIVLHTKGNKRYPQGDRPEQVEIPVHAKLNRMVFLVASAWTDERTKGVTVAEIVIKFAGGENEYETETISLKPGLNISDWWIRGGAVLRGGKLAWSQRDPRIPARIGVWMFDWENRQPQAEIETIIFKTNHTLAIPALIAVTGEKIRSH